MASGQGQALIETLKTILVMMVNPMLVHSLMRCSSRVRCNLWTEAQSDAASCMLCAMTHRSQQLLTMPVARAMSPAILQLLKRIKLKHCSDYCASTLPRLPPCKRVDQRWRKVEVSENPGSWLFAPEYPEPCDGLPSTFAQDLALALGEGLLDSCSKAGIYPIHICLRLPTFGASFNGIIKTSRILKKFPTKKNDILSLMC